MNQSVPRDLPQLKSNLLGELLQGKHYSAEALKAKLELYNLSFREGDAFSLMLVRVEEDFTGRDFQSMSLMEYAIINIAEELGEHDFDIWACKDVHEHLVLGLKPKNRLDDGTMGYGNEFQMKRVEQFAIQIQESAKLYLKVGVSVIVAQWRASGSYTRRRSQRCVSG
ncbi:hypothetical protein I8J29_09525 [Paenibacillus sp. MWE-103]|uniref:Transposase IS200 family protein n=1 Tax=Paenibacillus artemisiicola TaxID=1172618 RepID=A0ABS3W808_9BACL|nr:hypothetical protein [Paenibacillus artemisiicola]MBO7744434.1 hypothetical protein [Paenibacillus artemisiicola]